MKIRVGSKYVGENYPCFIVAEAGINHNGSLKIAKKMISAAKKVGADAIKFQTFKADDLAIPTSKFYKIFKKVELLPEEFGELNDYAKSKSIIFFSTPSSEESVDILSKINVPAYKISSGDLTNIPLLRYVAKKKKPMIISSGMSTFNEIKDAVQNVKLERNNKIILLHSVSSYPTPPSETNLNVIQNLKQKYPFPVGYSDNGSGLLVSIIAVAVGAKLIEKHFTLNKKMKGPDHLFSADANELGLLVKRIREVEQLLGNGIKAVQPSERKNRILARKGITAKKTIKPGLKITKKMISIMRPATGISPDKINQILGKTTKRRIKRYQPIKWEYLS